MLIVLHAQLPPLHVLEPGDCLIIARDITLCSLGSGFKSVASQKDVWVSLKYGRWLEKPADKHTVSTWGNLNVLGEFLEVAPKLVPWYVLRDKAVKLMGVKF